MQTMNSGEESRPRSRRVERVILREPKKSVNLGVLKLMPSDLVRSASKVSVRRESLPGVS